MTGSKMHSPIHRARDLVVGWIGELPENIQGQAIASLDVLCAVAVQQAEQAWLDGYRSRQDADKRDTLREKTSGQIAHD